MPWGRGSDAAEAGRGGWLRGHWSAAEGTRVRWQGNGTSKKAPSNSFCPSPGPTGLRLFPNVGHYSRSRLRAEARPKRERKQWPGYSTHPAAPCVHSVWPGVLSAGGTAWSQWAGGRARPALSGSRSWNAPLCSRGARVTWPQCHVRLGPALFLRLRVVGNEDLGWEGRV